MLLENVRLGNENVAGGFIMRGGLCTQKVNVDASYFYVLFFYATAFKVESSFDVNDIL